MKRFNTIYVFAILLVSITSCEEEIKFKGKELEPKLVVNCFIGNDGIIVANVEQTTPIQAEITSSTHVSNATVKLYEDDQFVRNLTRDTITIIKNYSSKTDYVYLAKNFTTTPGKRYTITAEAPNFESVMAQTIIPKPIEIIKIDTFTVKNFDRWMGQQLRRNFKITFKDTPNEKNYYRILLKLRSGHIIEYNNKTVTDTPHVFVSPLTDYMIQSKDLSINPQSENEGDIFSQSSTNSFVVFNDDLFDGKEHSISFFIDGFYQQALKKYEFNEYIIELQSISKDYYLYAQSLSLQMTRDGDFFAEPVQVYSNVDKGLGVFASYSAAQKTIIEGIYPSDSVIYDTDKFYYGK